MARCCLHFQKWLLKSQTNYHSGPQAELRSEVQSDASWRRNSMLFLLCMTNYLQAGRNLLGWKIGTGDARSPATPLSSRAALAPAAREMQKWGCEGNDPHPEALVGAAGCGVLPGWLGRVLAWAQTGWSRGWLQEANSAGYHSTQQLSASFCRESSGEQMVKHPTRDSRSHPLPSPPTAPDTSKFPELIDYQGQISILPNYNLGLMHVFTLYLFHVGN